MPVDGLSNSKPMIVAAICARGGSKGVPRKNIRPLNGVPLMGLTIQCAQACSRLGRIVVSTDDQEMASVGRSFGAEVPFMRPRELAQGHTSKWLVFRHLVSTIEQIDGRRVDVLVDLDTGVPLRTPGDIETCIDMLLSTDSDVVTTAYEAERNPYFNMVEVHDGLARIVCQPATPIASRQAAPTVYNLSPAVFAIKRDALWEAEHWSKSRFRISVMPRERAIDIDTEVDFALVEFLMNRSSTTGDRHG
jgi:N-acylneuraminate cytidylyltransferase/CMP-N,N'-diacetyllegionaminic acid synthase